MNHIESKIADCYRRFISDVPVIVRPHVFLEGTTQSGRITTYAVFHNAIRVATYSAETRLIEADRKGQNPFKPHSKHFSLLLKLN